MNCQMIRVISSPSSSTTGFLTLILLIRRPTLSASPHHGMPAIHRGDQGQLGGRAHRAILGACRCQHMGMFGGGGSIQLARVFGIRIGVNASWFFILFLMIYG